MKNFIKIASCFLILSGISTKAQTDPDLEISSASSSTVGPVQSFTVNFLKDSTNPAAAGTFVSAPNPLSITLSISNSQYPTANTLNTLSTNAMNLGFIGSSGRTLQTLAIGGNGSAGSDYIYSGYAALPTGITTGAGATANYTVPFYVGTDQFRTGANQKLTNATVYMGDLTVTFSRPVKNPILHFTGMGGGGTQGYTTRFDLDTPTVSLSKKSGTNTFNVSSNIISNTTSTHYVNTGTSGSVLVGGTNITVVKFKVYIIGDGIAGTDSATGYTSYDSWSNGAGTAGDGLGISASLSESDLAVTKTVDNITPTIGSNVNFTIGATNNGMSKSPETKVTDLLPSGYTYVSSVTSGGTYNNITGIWDIGEMAIGAGASMTIVAKVNATGNYTNTATIAGFNTDPVSANNTASVSTTPFNACIITASNPDSDGDGVANLCDLDDDNDGILDTEEGVCTPTSPLSSTGWKATVYDAPSTTDAWGEISAANTFPTASYYPIATFDYNEFAGTSDAFDFNFATGAIGLNLQIQK